MTVSKEPGDEDQVLKFNELTVEINGEGVRGCDVTKGVPGFTRHLRTVFRQLRLKGVALVLIPHLAARWASPGEGGGGVGTSRDATGQDQVL